MIPWLSLVRCSKSWFIISFFFQNSRLDVRQRFCPIRVESFLGFLFVFFCSGFSPFFFLFFFQFSLFVFFSFISILTDRTGYDILLSRQPESHRVPSASQMAFFFTLFQYNFSNFTGFYRVLLGFIGFYWVLPGFTGFYWVWLGFTRFSMALSGFTGFHQFSPGF